MTHCFTSIAALGLALTACDTTLLCGENKYETDAGACDCNPGFVWTEDGLECVALDGGSSAATAEAGQQRDAGIDARATPWVPVGSDDVGEGELDASDTDAVVDAADDGGQLDAEVDAAPACVPGTEVCNGKDDDCDSLVDEPEDVKEKPIGESCSNGGEGACTAAGVQVCFNGAPKCNAPPPTPQPETCDGIDNDCKNGVDDGVKNACGGCGAVPAEVCDNADNDCDGQVDEGVKNACGACGVVPTETCDGADNDCNGQIDEGVKNACGACGPVPAESCSTPADDNCNGQVNEGCIACGDGVLSGTEACDPTAPGWSAWTCTNQCQIQRSYTTCSSDQGCAGGRCIGGICTRICNSTGECPAPGLSATVVKPYCDSTLTTFVDGAWRKICGLAYCSSSDQCPPHQDCAPQNPDLPTQPRLCAPRICTADSVCGPGLKCSANVCVEP